MSLQPVVTGAAKKTTTEVATHLPSSCAWLEWFLSDDDISPAWMFSCMIFMKWKGDTLLLWCVFGPEEMNAIMTLVIYWVTSFHHELDITVSCNDMLNDWIQDFEWSLWRLCLFYLSCSVAGCSFELDRCISFDSFCVICRFLWFSYVVEKSNHTLEFIACTDEW